MDDERIVLNVLVACEESQAECKAFRELGHNAYSCDLQPCNPNGNPEWHIKGDVTPYLEGSNQFTTQAGFEGSVSRWDLIICHPPCTYLCKLSSVQMAKDADEWIVFQGEAKHINSDRFYKMYKGRNFFFKCLNASAPYVAVENPLPMALARLPSPDAFACPSWFGVKYTKKTCYWLKNLPPIFAEIEYPNPKCYVNSSRGKYRSRTFPQMAKALAKQWSNCIIEDIKQGRYKK